MKVATTLCGSILLVLACSAHAAGSAIAIKKFAFAPQELTVAPGTTVTWTNQDETPHTIIATDGSYVSKAMDTDDRFEHTFASEGDYNYFCTLHPFMKGVVHVRANAGANAPPPKAQ